MFPDFNLHRPATLTEACDLLAATGGVPLAGGTDLIPMMRAGKKSLSTLIDLTLIGELRHLFQEGDLIHLGPLVTHTQLEASELIEEKAGLLAQAAAAIGSPQIRNRGTVGGNIATASPAADTVPPLLVLEAQATLVSRGGERKVPLAELLLGPGETGIEEGEIIFDLTFPALPRGYYGLFLKLGRRRAMAISVATVAVVVGFQEEVVWEARIALGAVAPTAIRVPQAEEVLRGGKLDEQTIREAGEAAREAARPISDIRASAEYRREMVNVLVERALKEVNSRRMR